MDSFDPDYGKFLKPAPRPSLKPLGVSNSLSSYDRKGGFYGGLQKSPPGVRKTLFESRNKENEESMLCKDFSDREVTGKSPVVVQLNRFKNESNSDEAEEKRIKPRRSMLGLRSKSIRPSFSQDDSTYTLSKPLHSSSPVSDSYRQQSRTEQRLQKATSSPSLNHPFDNDDPDMSSFFSKGISDSSTWSVFKSNKNNGKSTKYTQETPLSRVSLANQVPASRFQNNDGNTARSSWMETHNSTYSKDSKKSALSVTADQKMQLEWLSLKFQNDNTLSNSTSVTRDSGNKTEKNPEPRKSYRNDKLSALKHEIEDQATFGARTRAQAKKEREKCLGGSNRIIHKSEAISPIPHEKEDSGCDDKSLNSITICDNDSSQDSSMDSYVQNEATIIGTCKKQLKDINDENPTRLTISSKNGDTCDEMDCSDEYLSTNEDSSESSFMNNISNLIGDLKAEKEQLDLKLSSYLEQKKSYDRKWDRLMICLEEMKINYDSNEKSKIKTSQQENIKIKKSRQSHVSSSVGSLSRPAAAVPKQFSGLKANFNCLKTPVQSSDKLKKIRKSTCYTPNSLSVLVGDQVKDIFGDM